MICDNIDLLNEHLCFAGRDVCELAEKYGTPLYLMDEDKIREKCRMYTAAMKQHFPENSKVLFASKANSFRQIYRIVSDMGLGIDVVSSGEIYTAKSAGFDMADAFFHGNNKTPEDIRYAMDNGVGYFVADNRTELFNINEEAVKRGIIQPVLLRVTPGIDCHTYEKINTGKVDSKFGEAIGTGQAEDAVRYALELKGVKLLGYDCHIGSQVFAEDVYERASVLMLEFASEMREKYGCDCEYIDLGGGFGVPYVENDGRIDINEKIGQIADTVKETCERLKMPVPGFIMEPGRSIVADAGMTLYTCGNVKKIPGYKNYVSIDGGMTDNPRYALYGSKYTCFAANKIQENCTMTADVVGRCCESGDIIQPMVNVPESIKPGDIIAVCTTGAYNYSMSSNYNRIPKPPIVMLKGGEDYVAVRRQTFEEMCADEI